MSVGLNRKPKGPRKSEVGELANLAVGTNKQILGFEVPVENTVRMQEDERLQDLVEQTLALLGRQSRAHLLLILLEVKLEIFEHQVELLLAEQDFLESEQKCQLDGF